MIKSINHNDTSLYILCFNLNNFSEKIRFGICCALVFFFFIIYGYVQELIFTLDSFKSHGWYLTCIQFGFYGIFGLVEKSFQNATQSRKIPFKTYLLLALLTLGTMGFSNASLSYLNYPTEVIFKCCKLIPVLIGGTVIQGKQFKFIDFLAAFLMCFGLIFFTIAESNTSPNFNSIGILMISFALLCDAIIGNVQEKYMKKFQASNAEVVLYSYSIGFIYILLILLTNGEFQSGYVACSKNIIQSYGCAFCFSLSGYLGIQVVLTLIRSYGAFIAATVTTCRKAVTIVLSFVFFTKPFTFQYVWSGLIVLLGIYLNIYSKQYSLTLNGIRETAAKLFSAINLKNQSAKTSITYDDLYRNV